MKQIISELLEKIIYQVVERTDGCDVRLNYSGKFMFGDTCFGIVCPDHDAYNKITNEIESILYECRDDDEFCEAYLEAKNLFRNVYTDSMGKGFIFYYKDYQLPNIFKN